MTDGILLRVSEKRPAIPAAMRRAVMVEAGHRCAIPTCRMIPVELHHIEPWATVRTHEAHNLIALCPTCHARVTSGDIDRKSVQAYKANLQLLNSRYGDLERRVLENAASQDMQPGQSVVLPGQLEWLMEYLVRDSIFLRFTPGQQVLYEFAGHSIPGMHEYRLTKPGRELVERIRSGQPI